MKSERSYKKTQNIRHPRQFKNDDPEIEVLVKDERTNQVVGVQKVKFERATRRSTLINNLIQQHQQRRTRGSGLSLNDELNKVFNKSVSLNRDKRKYKTGEVSFNQSSSKTPLSASKNQNEKVNESLNSIGSTVGNDSEYFIQKYRYKDEIRYRRMRRPYSKVKEEKTDDSNQNQ